MDQQTNQQEPSSTEGGEMKAGDKVWVLCEVAMVYNHESLYVDIRHDGAVFEAKRSDCRPVEPANSSEIPDSSSDPLAPSSCMDGVDVDQFIEGVMEARGRTSDPINPGHYKQGGIECIEAIKAATGDGFIGYVWGNVLKYLWRWPKKGGVDDLKKARWYLDRLIKEAGE
jgi:hypothetical protein